MDLDRERETRPFERVQVVVPVVVERRRPRPRAKTRGEQRSLCLFGVLGDEIEVAEAAGSVRIAAAELRTLDEQEPPVVHLSRAGEQDRRDERGHPGGALFAREPVRRLLSAQVKPASRERRQAVVADAVRPEPLEQPLDSVPQPPGALLHRGVVAGARRCDT